MSRTDFIVAFHGEAVDGGRMDVRDLAPALLSLGRAIDGANLIINGERQPVKVEVHALSRGSFQVDLQVVLTGWEQIKSLLTDADVDAAKQLLEWIGLLAVGGGATAGGVIGLYRFLNGRKPERIERAADGFALHIDGKTLVVPAEVLRLYREMTFNQSLNELLDALESPGIDRVEFKRPRAEQPDLVLTSTDRPAFRLPRPPDVQLTDETRTLALSIRSLAFQEGNKWRLYDGQNIITATIDDRDFVARIDASQVRFAKGDVLLCDVRSVQTQGLDGLRTEHFVLRVREHRPAPTQLPLEFET